MECALQSKYYLLTDLTLAFLYQVRMGTKGGYASFLDGIKNWTETLA
jgi:hypothetical protein